MSSLKRIDTKTEKVEPWLRSIVWDQERPISNRVSFTKTDSNLPHRPIIVPAFNQIYIEHYYGDDINISW